MGLERLFPDFAVHEASGFAGLAFAKPAIMIAATPRTGSTHLCRALHQAGQSTEPNEIFNARGDNGALGGPASVECAQRGVTRFADYLASFAQGPDPVFIFKTGWTDAAPLAPVLTKIFPGLRVIYLNRMNIAAQAVSQFRAELSGTWHLNPGDEAPSFDPTDKFNLTRLLAIVKRMETDKRLWEGWFAAYNISPLRLDYRQIETDIEGVLQRIIAEMNLPLPGRLPPGAGKRKLADAVSADWTERVQRRLYNLS